MEEMLNLYRLLHTVPSQFRGAPQQHACGAAHPGGPAAQRHSGTGLLCNESLVQDRGKTRWSKRQRETSWSAGMLAKNGWESTKRLEKFPSQPSCEISWLVMHLGNPASTSGVEGACIILPPPAGALVVPLVCEGARARGAAHEVRFARGAAAVVAAAVGAAAVAALVHECHRPPRAPTRAYKVGLSLVNVAVTTVVLGVVRLDHLMPPIRPVVTMWVSSPEHLHLQVLLENSSQLLVVHSLKGLSRGYHAIQSCLQLCISASSCHR
mmetsp:Transcript_58878/g.120471  ORF Transcript_58878/g.120471 Transcript_58878/m.120471 type:complete len:267 (+) Transcript_58878:117-917(+)